MLGVAMRETSSILFTMFTTFMRPTTVTGCAMVPEEHGIHLDFLFFLLVSFFTHFLGHLLKFF
jgi:hypothetical protein